MTLIIKVINGIKYYYYQDNIKVENKNKVISTFIGKTDLSHNDTINARAEALIKHLTKLFRTLSIISKSPYRFEQYRSTQHMNDLLEFIRLFYELIKRDLFPQELEEFHKTIFIKYVHGTTAIEGNTLSEGETYTLLVDDLTPKNKSVNEINEVYNYNRIKEYLDTYSTDVNERLIKKIHQIMVNNIVDKHGRLFEAGKYRTAATTIRGVYHSLSRPDKIEEDIDLLIDWYKEGVKNQIHPIELASIFHQKFELIHPFRDYNGRTGREILNFMLTHNGFPPIYITPFQRSEYLNALQEADLSNHTPLINFVIQRINATMAYLISKTHYAGQLQSDDFKMFISNIGGQEIANLLTTMLNQYNQSKDIP